MDSGCTTTTLQATDVGEHLYLNLGYRRLCADAALGAAAAMSLNPALEDASFCPRCASPATVTFPRSITCATCGYGAFYNPKPVACAITANPDNDIILLKRGFEPNRGRWSMPGGFVDLGESVEDAAIRETKEETNLEIELDRSRGCLLSKYRPDRGRGVRGSYRGHADPDRGSAGSPSLPADTPSHGTNWRSGATVAHCATI